MVTGERENNKTDNTGNTGHADINHRIGFINGMKGKGKLDGDLDTKEVTRFRACIARMNYLANDNPDIMFAVKELARKMSKPDNADLERMRRLARFLKGRPRSVTWYRYQEEPNTLEVFTDSDWAGCRVTKRSTFERLRDGWHALHQSLVKDSSTKGIEFSRGRTLRSGQGHLEWHRHQEHHEGLRQEHRRLHPDRRQCRFWESCVEKVWDECATWTLTCFGYRTRARARRSSTGQPQPGRLADQVPQQH